MDIDTHAKFDKLKIATRYWLLGAGAVNPAYHKVSEAFEFGLQHHNGTRNGGAPEFIHQLRIFQHARTQHKALRNPTVVYMLIFCHDMVEDPNQATGAFVSPAEICERFGPVIERKVRLLSKKILGQENPDYSLDSIFEDVDCSIVKPLDRCDNLLGLVDVFKKPRAFRYIKETEEEFIPRMQKVRRRFVDQEGVYEDAKKEIQYQLHLAKPILGYGNTTTETCTT